MIDVFPTLRSPRKTSLYFARGGNPFDAFDPELDCFVLPFVVTPGPEAPVALSAVPEFPIISIVYNRIAIPSLSVYFQHRIFRHYTNYTTPPVYAVAGSSIYPNIIEYQTGIKQK
mmetsp:Transcript_3400/g.3799  ORF Transcript_3400/g.3799 Transcript_3400/m.3799 type:complete len:115 (+) Transcript_3400:703-1047(+)